MNVIRAWILISLLGGLLEPAVSQERGRPIQPPGNPVVATPEPTAPCIIRLPDRAGFQILPREEGISILQLLPAWSDATGRRLVWAQGPGLHLLPRMTLSEPITVREHELDSLLQSWLVTNGLYLEPLGSASPPVFRVSDIDSTRIGISTATSITADRLEEAEQNPAIVYHITVLLNEIDASSVQGLQTLQNLRTVERMLTLPDGNGAVIVGFGPTVARVTRTLKLLDRAPPEALEKRRPKAVLPHGR